MSAPSPAEIFERAVEEGHRRLDQSLLALLSNSFIAGFTIVFGILALAVVQAMVEPVSSHLAPLAGALAFGVGLVFLIVGRTELFTENFFDPVAAEFEEEGSQMLGKLLRLWVVTLVLNLVGGVLFELIFLVDGSLPRGATGVLRHHADSIAKLGGWALFVRAIVGGALVAVLSFLLQAVNHVGSRITLAYLVGVLLTLGPFGHVVVTVLILTFGMLLGADVSLIRLAEVFGIVIAGNLVGGLGLVTLSHIAQATGEGE